MESWDSLRKLQINDIKMNFNRLFDNF